MTVYRLARMIVNRQVESSLSTNQHDFLPYLPYYLLVISHHLTSVLKYFHLNSVLTPSWLKPQARGPPRGSLISLQLMANIPLPQISDSARGLVRVPLAPHIPPNNRDIVAAAKLVRDLANNFGMSQVSSSIFKHSVN